MSQLRHVVYSFFLLLLGHVAAQKNEFDDSNGGTPFDPTMGIIIVIIILVSFFFVLVCVSIYMRRYHQQDPRIDNNGGSRDSGNWLNVRQTERGLDASVVETFPTFRYSTVKTLGIGKEALECPVCLNEFEDEETLRLIPQCCHAFHPSCIDAWLRSNTTCPLCRANLVPVSCESVSFDTSAQNSPKTPIDDIRCGCEIRLRVLG